MLKDLVGACVWKKRVAGLSFGDERRQHDPSLPPGLDGCRIHRERYEQAKKMCFDFWAEEKEESEGVELEETEENMLLAIDDTMGEKGMRTHKDGRAPTTPEFVLEDLDLKEFAEYLRSDAAERGRTINFGSTTLEDIKREILHPFRDARGECPPRGLVEADRLFELLTSETDATLRVGSLVFAKFTRFERGRMDGTPGRMHGSCSAASPAPSTRASSRRRCERLPTVEVDGRSSRSCPSSRARSSR